MDIYTTTIAASVLVYIAVGNYAGRGVRRLDDYYVAGRRAPTLIIVGTLVASLMSSTMFLGEAGFAYATQAGPYVLFPQAAAAGYVLGALFFGRYLRRSRATTLPGYFGDRFASRRIRTLAGITVVLALSGYLLAVTQGAAILLSELTALTYTQGLVAGWLSYTLFTMYSGSRGVILTDTLMFLLFTVASVLAMGFLMDDFGGVPAVVEGLVAVEEKPQLLSWHGMVGPGTEWPTATDYLIWAIVVDVSWMLVYMVSPWQSSRHLMARDEHVVVRAATLAAIAVVLLQVLVYGMGGAINLDRADIFPPERATVWAALNMMPEFLGALMLAGIVAAVLSSASTFLSLVGFSVTSDIGLRPGADEAATLRFSRFMMLAAGAVVLLAGMVFEPQIFWLTTFIATVFASSWGPVGLMSVWSRRITEAAAYWGMLAGLVFNLVPKFFEFIGVIALPAYLDPAILGGTASLIVVLAVSARTGVGTQEAAYLAMLHRRPPEETDAGRTRRTLLAPAVLLLVNGVVLPWLLLSYYVRPYQRATGDLLADGSLDLLTGEVALIAAWVLIWVALGVFTIRYLRRAYTPPGGGAQ